MTVTDEVPLSLTLSVVSYLLTNLNHAVFRSPEFDHKLYNRVQALCDLPNMNMILCQQ